jgi:hypothetical protein
MKTHITWSSGEGGDAWLSPVSMAVVLRPHSLVSMVAALAHATLTEGWHPVFEAWLHLYQSERMVFSTILKHTSSEAV